MEATVSQYSNTRLNHADLGTSMYGKYNAEFRKSSSTRKTSVQLGTAPGSTVWPRCGRAGTGASPARRASRVWPPSPSRLIAISRQPRLHRCVPELPRLMDVSTCTSSGATEPRTRLMPPVAAPIAEDGAGPPVDHLSARDRRDGGVPPPVRSLREVRHVAPTGS
jgi:hypothetical protein